MAWIWTLFLLLSATGAVVTKQTAALSSAVLEGASSAVTLMLSLAGPLCLWSGLTKVMEETGLTDRLSALCAPLLRRLFPQTWTDRPAREALCGNLSANFLGLGNAATPLGIRAVRLMAQGSEGTASDELCRLVVMNTASIQLLPTTVAAVRASQGAQSPFDILPAVWLTSVCSVAAGLLAARGLSRWL